MIPTATNGCDNRGIQEATPDHCYVSAAWKLWRCLGNGLSFCGNSKKHNFPWNPSKSHCSRIKTTWFVKWLPMPAPLFTSLWLLWEKASSVSREACISSRELRKWFNKCTNTQSVPPYHLDWIASRAQLQPRVVWMGMLLPVHETYSVVLSSSFHHHNSPLHLNNSINK